MADRLQPEFASLDQWEELTDMRKRTSYEHIGLGNLRAFKVGSKTVIDVPHGLAFMRSLPAAVIKPPGPRKGSRKTAAVRTPDPPPVIKPPTPRRGSRKTASAA
jgi:hypothetical protein